MEQARSLSASASLEGEDMKRLLMCTGFALVCAGAMQAQTMSLFPTGTQDPNAVAPILSFPVTATCDQPKQAETVAATDRPDGAIWSDVNPARDCVADLRSTPMSSLPTLAPSGYQAAIKVGSGKYGTLSNAFLAPAAQTGCQVVSGQPFSVLMDHDGKITTGYRLYIQGSQVGPDYPAASVFSNGVVTLPHTGLAAGAFTAEVGAFNASGEVKSPTTSCQSVLPRPSAGTNTRVRQP